MEEHICEGFLLNWSDKTHFYSESLRWEDTPLIWAMSFAGSLSKAMKEGSFCSLPGFFVFLVSLCFACFLFFFFSFFSLFLPSFLPFMSKYSAACTLACQKRVSDPFTDGHEPLCGYWELNSGSLEEQPVLLTGEPSLQHHSLPVCSCLTSTSIPSVVSSGLYSD